MKRRLLAAGAAVVLVAVAAGTYAIGHANGVSAGTKAGREAALRGVTPADMALIRQLAGDRAVAAQTGATATPAPAATAAPQGKGVDCEGRGDIMAKSAGCSDSMFDGGTTPVTGPTAAVDPAGAVPAATAYLAWLSAHPLPNEPLLMSRLVDAEVALPAGASATGIEGPAADDADGQVQVSMNGAFACVLVLAAKVDSGQCYAGAEQNTGGGDYGPKRFPPAYQRAE